MKRILFLIHDLGPGGAEKVLVNLVNHLDRTKFDVSVRTLLDIGVNRQFLNADVHYSAWIPGPLPGNSYLMKLWNPEQLWKKVIPDQYDIVVSFLEGPCARVVGGCPNDGTKIVSWVHTPISFEEKFIEGFRNKTEAESCYSRADALVFVSHDVKKAFLSCFPTEQRSAVLYNAFESDRIRTLAAEEPADPNWDPTRLNWCSVGKLIPLKGWTRLLDIHHRLLMEGYPAHFYLIGEGPQRAELEKRVRQQHMEESVTFTGYQTNPYAYVSRCLVYACASMREGFSTAVVESLLVGTPVCTVDVGGMREILGGHDEYGVVTENDDEELYDGIRKFFQNPGYQISYRERAILRGNTFDQCQAVKAVEELLLSL